MKRILILIILSLLVFDADAQKFKKKKTLFAKKDSRMSSRKNRDMIDFNAYRYGGWYVDPGFTYTMSNQEAIGGLGYYIGFGRFQVVNEYPSAVNYIDYGLALKNLRKDPLRTHNLVANFNAYNVWQIADKTFIQNGLGVNVDYSIIGSMPYSPPLLTQLHYKFGLGFQFWQRLFVIPSVEIPLLNVYPFSTFNSTINYNAQSSNGLDFNTTKLRSFVFTLRFAWLSPLNNGLNCPAPRKSKKKIPKGNDQSRAQDRYKNK